MVNIIHRRITLLMHDEPTHCLLPCSRLCPYSNIFQPVFKVRPGIEWCLGRLPCQCSWKTCHIKCRHGTICSWPLHGVQSTLSSFCWQVCILDVRFQNDSVMPTSCSPLSLQPSVGSWSFTLLALATRTWPSQLLGHATLLVKTLHSLVCLPGGISSDQVVLPPKWLGGPAESVKSLVTPANCNWLLLVWLRWLCCLCIHHTVDVHCLQESSDCFARTSPWLRIIQSLLLLIRKQHEMERQLHRRDATWAKASDQNESNC